MATSMWIRQRTVAAREAPPTCEAGMRWQRPTPSRAVRSPHRHTGRSLQPSHCRDRAPPQHRDLKGQIAKVAKTTVRPAAITVHTLAQCSSRLQPGAVAAQSDQGRVPILTSSPDNGLKRTTRYASPVDKAREFATPRHMQPGRHGRSRTRRPGNHAPVAMLLRPDLCTKC